MRPVLLAAAALLLAACRHDRATAPIVTLDASNPVGRWTGTVTYGSAYTPSSETVELDITAVGAGTGARSVSATGTFGGGTTYRSLSGSHWDGSQLYLQFGSDERSVLAIVNCNMADAHTCSGYGTGPTVRTAAPDPLLITR